MSQITGKGYRRRRFDDGIDDDDVSIETRATATIEFDPHSITPSTDLDSGHSSENNSPPAKPRARSDVQGQKSHETQMRRKFDAQVKQLRRSVQQLESASDLTPKEADELKEKKQLLEEIFSSKEDSTYILPSEYRNSDGGIDRQRKRDLLKAVEPVDEDHFQKRTKYSNHWEEAQLKKAQEIVSANPDETNLPGQQQYEFVFDESQFVDYEEEAEIPGTEGETIDAANKYNDIQAVRRSLPAFKYRQKFLDTMENNQVVIVVGETGSGKTTQIPQYLYEEGYTKARSPNGQIMKVGCTQPRRVAATSVARRVADEVGCKIGSEVGYSIRFEDETSKNTAIKYLTDGMLLREFLTDPTLSTYSVLMIDEAHERTVSTEIILTLLKDIIKERPDLKLIVASATINASKFSDYFNKAPVFNIPGRRFPVDVCYTKQPEANYIQAAVTTIFQIHTKQEGSGDILVFLTGQEEIETMDEILRDACDKLGDSIKKLIVAPIYANLPPKMQARIFEPTPPGSRKVVLATNIAETSITIDGIKYVIDSGYVKENVFNASTGMESLVVVPCSQASADQRAGRAGRVGPGKCYRLFTKWSYTNELQANPTPEILRVNLSTVVLLLLSMGINDLVNFDFMDPPSKQTLIKSLELLYALGALNSKGQLTDIGKKMASFPMDPMFCKALLTSAEYSVTSEVLSILAMLSESSSLFHRPKDKREQADKRKESFMHIAGDQLTLLNIWKQWSDSGFSNLWCEDNFLQYRTLKRAKEIKTQLETLCTKIGIDVKPVAGNSEDDTEKVQKALLSGFFPNLARISKMGSNYVLLKRNQPVYIHPSSALFKTKPPAKLLLYHELVLTSKEYMRNCMIIEEKWVNEAAPHYYREEELKLAKS